MDFLNLNNKTFGLGISDLSIKIISLRKKGKFLSLSSWGETRIKPGVIENGEVKDREELSKTIKISLEKVKGNKLKTKNVIVSLPEIKAFLQVIKMPKMEENELKTAVPFEAENYIPLPIEKVYLDFEIIRSNSGYSKDHLNILLAAIPKEIVDSYVYCLNKAGLHIKALEIESQSISRALFKNQLTTFPVLIIDFGRSRTNFIIFSGHSLRFTSSIPVSSQKLTQAISNSLNVNFSEAEKLKIKYGLQAVYSKNMIGKTKAKNGKEEEQVFEAMLPVLIDLVEQIKKHVNYYQNHTIDKKNGKLKKILLCGKGTNLKKMTDFLSFELKIPVELGNPWVNILPSPLKELPGLSFEESLGYSTALGLALRGIKDET